VNYVFASDGSGVEAPLLVSGPRILKVVASGSFRDNKAWRFASKFRRLESYFCRVLRFRSSEETKLDRLLLRRALRMQRIGLRRFESSIRYLAQNVLNILSIFVGRPVASVRE
jgi:hypothetical protein